MEPSLTESPGDVTALLRRWRTGDRDAEARLFELVMPHLRGLANRYFRGERAGHTLQPTALLNEAYIRLAGAKQVDWRDRRHFFALSARVMRRCLIDHARKRRETVPLPSDGGAELVGSDWRHIETAIVVDRLLEELAKESPEQCALIELRYFLGLTETETAEALHLSLTTAQRRLREARAWLLSRLELEGKNAKRSVTTSSS
jgi:RNA polymerase sigma factor (TIGR02999 family)